MRFCCTDLRNRKEVGDETYAAAVRMFGVDGVLDLIAAYGYYSMIGMFLNVNESRPTDGPLMSVAER